MYVEIFRVNIIIRIRKDSLLGATPGEVILMGDLTLNI